MRHRKSGGFAEVWYAERDDGLGVAAKVLHPRHVSSRPVRGPSPIQRFIEEAHFHARLRVEGLVAMLDVVDQRDDGIIALIMEYLCGRDSLGGKRRRAR